MRFKDTYEGWTEKRLTQIDAPSCWVVAPALFAASGVNELPGPACGPRACRGDAASGRQMKPEGAQSGPFAPTRIAWSENWRSRVLPIGRPLTGICKRRIDRLITPSSPSHHANQDQSSSPAGTGASWTMCSANSLSERCAKIATLGLQPDCSSPAPSMQLTIRPLSGVKGTSIQYQGFRSRTSRKPTLKRRLDGAYLLRFAERRFRGELFQEPPRTMARTETSQLVVQALPSVGAPW